MPRLTQADRAWRDITRERLNRIEAYWRSKANLGDSEHWTSQQGAREIIALYGCKLCTWRYPGEIFDVAGDLWCHLCVHEQRREIPDLPVRFIPWQF